MASKDYPFAARLLHRAVLGSRALSQTLFDIDGLAAKDAGTLNAPSSPVFITGLPRSGSTFLLNVLNRDPAFHSLSYQDMPFVMMPVLWRRLSAAHIKELPPRERFHRDGIAIDASSVEAFEEIFWRTFCGSDYIKHDHLQAHAPDPGVLEKFKRYTARVTGGHGRYLSKNNNNILRLPALRHALPDARILVLYRDPLQQSASMLKQHRLFQEAQRQDSFFPAYLRWLGHYEFGRDHRPARFGDGDLPGDRETLDYWVTYWHETYRDILTTAPDDVFFIDYDALCRGQGQFNVFLSETLSTRAALRPGDVRYASRSAGPVDETCREQAYRVHAALRSRSMLHGT